VGKVLLHLLIAVGVWFGEIFAMVIALSASWRNIADLSHLQPGSYTANKVGATEFLMLVAALLGWLLFVYLRTSVRVRTAILVCLTGGAVILGVSRVSAVLPRT
jgi:hypothetical protein